MKTHSLQYRITIISLCCLLTTAIISGIFSFFYIYEEIGELTDDNLENIALVIHHQTKQPTISQKSHHQDFYDDKENKDDDGIVIDIHDNIHFPIGFSNQKINGELWRVYHIKDKHDKESIIARERIAIKQELAIMGAVHALLPLLIISTLFALLLPLLIWYSFRSLRKSSQILITRKGHDLSPIEINHFPKEILPFINAMNDLLKKAKINMEHQKRFIADASHELRSPLTAISLQVQRLQMMNDPKKISAGLERLNKSIQKNQHLVESLLTIARLNNTIKHEKTDMVFVIKNIISLLLPIINHKNIDINTDIEQSCFVHIDETTLTLLIKNIIQNAILYTPDGGRIDIGLSKNQPPIGTLVLGKGKRQGVLLTIKDNGVGIDPDDYQKALQPFVRLDGERSDTSEQAGTGLGLSMVRSVCEQAGLDLYFSRSVWADGQGGLCVQIAF